MGIWDDLTGKTAADAAQAAASDTYQKQQGAITGITNYGNQYAGQFANLAKGYDPYVQTGYSANSQFQNLLNDPSSVSGLPGYQFALNQGLNAVDRGAAARSGVQNGATIKAEQRYGTGLADQTYGSQFARLMGASQQGQGALGAQNATIGQGLQGQLSTRNAAFGGQMNAAGTIGQGDVAAANAEAAGSQNLLNAGLKIGGMALGGMGGIGGLGSTIGSMFGGGGSSFANSGAPGGGYYGTGGSLNAGPGYYAR